MGGARSQMVRTRVCQGRTHRYSETAPNASFSGRNETTRASRAAPPPSWLNIGDLTPGDCLTVRLKGPDSSISALMGCRSSEAETTGNSSARRQPKRTNERERHCFPEPHGNAGWRRQMRTAGSANISHRMLRSSSILREFTSLPKLQKLYPQLSEDVESKFQLAMTSPRRSQTVKSRLSVFRNLTSCASASQCLGCGR